MMIMMMTMMAGSNRLVVPPVKGKGKGVNVDLYSALSSWHTSKALRYGTRSQGISQFYLHTPRSSINGQTVYSRAIPVAAVQLWNSLTTSCWLIHCQPFGANWNICSSSPQMLYTLIYWHSCGPKAEQLDKTRKGLKTCNCCPTVLLWRSS